MPQPEHLLREELAPFLTDQDLLAQLTGASPAKTRRALSRLTLDQMTALLPEELAHRTGLTPRQSRVIAAAAAIAPRLVRKAPGDTAEVPKSISCPEDVLNLLRPHMEHAPQEELHVLALDTRNGVISRRMIYRGNVNSSVVRPAELLRHAVLTAAPSVVIAHNHPSGDPTPSGADISITKETAEAARLMGIDLLDHVVIAPGGRFVSMKEQKMLQN